MKRMILVAVSCLLLASCGGDDGSSAPPPSVDVTGTWAGNITSIVGTQAATLNVVQTGANVTGNYSSPGPGAIGTVSGMVSGNALNFSLAITQPGCTGSFYGTGTVTTPSVGQPTMSFQFSGTMTCLGVTRAQSGNGTLTKQ
jgi:hypothetical protein